MSLAMLLRAAALCGASLLAACAANPARVEPPRDRIAHPSASAMLHSRGIEARRPSGSGLAAQAAAIATRLLGRPYRWGGTGPASFDCSGLVFYAYGRAGVRVPRTSQEQFRASRPLSLRRARPGDLVFFRLAHKVSHVGIYLGNGRFVHAPGKGKTVQVASLASRYYAQRFVRAGRLVP